MLHTMHDAGAKPRGGIKLYTYGVQTVTCAGSLWDCISHMCVLVLTCMMCSVRILPIQYGWLAPGEHLYNFELGDSDVGERGSPPSSSPRVVATPWKQLPPPTSWLRSCRRAGTL